MMNKLTPRGDVAKCKGINCDLKQSCLRHLRPEHTERQWWAEFHEFKQENTICDAYLNIEEP